MYCLTYNKSYLQKTVFFSLSVVKTLLFPSLIFVAAPLYSINWVGPNTGNWNDVVNWNPQQVPNSENVTAAIPSVKYPGPVTITMPNEEIKLKKFSARYVFTELKLSGTDNPLKVYNQLFASASTLTLNGVSLSMPDGGNINLRAPIYLRTMNFFLSSPFTADSNVTITTNGYANVTFKSPVTFDNLSILDGIEAKFENSVVGTTISLADQSGITFEPAVDRTYAMNIAGTGVSQKLNGIGCSGTNNITLSGDISGNLYIAAQVNELHLTGTNTFIGGILLFQGADLFGSSTSIPRGENIGIIAGPVESNVYFEEPAPGGTYAGSIGGSLNIVKQGEGNLTLSGGLDILGGITITTGTLTLSNTPFQGKLACPAITNNSALAFNYPSSETAQVGAITGTGTVVKRGTNLVDTASSASNYTGQTTIEGGTLAVRGSTGAIQNNATLQLGQNSSQTLTANGTFTQSTGGTINVFLSQTSTTAAPFTVTGAATLAGELALSVSPGIYRASSSYPVMTSAAIAGGSQFSNVTANENFLWRATYTATGVSVSPTQDHGVPVVPLAALAGNSKAVGDYYFIREHSFLGDSDFTTVTQTLTSLPEAEFESALIRITPVATAANPLATFQNDLEMGVILDRQFQLEMKKKKPKESDTPYFAYPRTGLFVEPVGVFYQQKKSEGALTDLGQVAFDSYTYGAGAGWDQVFEDKFILEGGVGYTHSNLVWRDNFGSSKWSTVYVAPFFGWFTRHAFANFMVLGAFNFYQTDRKVQFTGLDRTAKSKYNSYDLLLRANGGGRFNLTNNIWFQPEGTLNYLTIFTAGYKERGAGSLNLQVKKNTNYILQPSFRGKFIKQYTTKKFCYAPNIYLGWLANVMLKDQTLEARFNEAPNQLFFNIEGYTKTTNQLIIGGEFYLERFEKFICTSTFELNMLSKFKVYIANIKFEWLF